MNLLKSKKNSGMLILSGKSCRQRNMISLKQIFLNGIFQNKAVY